MGFNISTITAATNAHTATRRVKGYNNKISDKEIEKLDGAYKDITRTINIVVVIFSVCLIGAVICLYFNIP